MHLIHLGLPVRDQDRSGRFYQAYFDFDLASGQRYDDGTLIIRNADGFDLALHPVSILGTIPEFLHFGFRLAGPGQVRALLARLQGDSVPIIERYDQPGYVAFKCHDPDGHRVEAYWEPPTSP